jgi:hypothetical protein
MAIRRFSSFPAVSLPRPRFDRKVARKVLIRKDFSLQGESRKIFSLSFPERQGRGEAGATLPSSGCADEILDLLGWRPPVPAGRFVGSGDARQERKGHDLAARVSKAALLLGRG